MPCHLAPSTDNTRGHRERFIEMHARTHVFASSCFNRPVNEWNILTETLVFQPRWTSLNNCKFPICFGTYLYSNIQLSYIYIDISNNNNNNTIYLYNARINSIALRRFT